VAKTIPATQFPQRIQQLVEERQKHVDALALIDQMLPGVRDALSGIAAKPAAPAAAAAAPASPKRKRRRGRPSTPRAPRSRSWVSSSRTRTLRRRNSRSTTSLKDAAEAPTMC